MSLSILTIPDSFNFSPVLSPRTGMYVAPARPPCCNDPETEIEGYGAARDAIIIATGRLNALHDDLRAIELAATATEAAKAELIAATARGERPNQHEAARLDRQRHDHIAQAEVTTIAITRAEGDLQAAREAFRRVLRDAAECAINLMSEHYHEAAAAAATARRRAECYASWCSDASFAMQGANSVEALLAFLGVG
nr:hypothetical protein [uncultured Lichenicoccus sp.]